MTEKERNDLMAAASRYLDALLQELTPDLTAEGAAIVACRAATKAVARTNKK